MINYHKELHKNLKRVTNTNLVITLTKRPRSSEIVESADGFNFFHHVLDGDLSPYQKEGVVTRS